MTSPINTKSQPSKWRKGSAGDLVDEFFKEGQGGRDSLEVPQWTRLNLKTNWLRPKTVCVIGGPTGRGKSLFLLEALLSLHDQGVSWALLPLEDTAADVYRRILAFLTRSWLVLDTSKVGADTRQEMIVPFLEQMASLEGHIWENPRLPIGEPGKKVIPPLPSDDALRWIEGASKSNRVVAVDPIAQIDWTGGKPWETQANFMRRLLGLAADSASTIILVAHSAKRPGKAAKEELSAEDIQGAAEFTRLAHTVLLWQGHEDRRCNVWRPGAMSEPVEHNRTLTIGKARNGPGVHLSLAYRTRDDGPGYDELGVIAPKLGEGKG